MTDHSLAPVLDFVLHERHWPPSPRLHALARNFPPIACAGLELHLNGGARTDLQLRVKSEADWARLRFFLSHHRPAPSSGAWASLARLCQAEMLPVDEIWLEVDDGGTESAPPLSIFARLAETGDRADPADVLVTLHRLLAACGVSCRTGTSNELERCVLALRDGAALTHIGMMLGREHAPFRIIVDSVQATDFAGFLSRAGLGHRALDVQHCVDTLFVFADRIRLALTLTDRWHEDIGLECFVGDGKGSDPRIEQLLQHLVGKGLADTAIRQHLQAWPTRLYPHEAHGGWPGSLIAQALGEEGQQPLWLDCRISHVKVTVADDRITDAKAYFGFVQEAGPLAAPTPPPSMHRRDAVASATSAALAQAIGRGGDALLAARNQAGWWLDYEGFSEGTSDEWVTAYVAGICAGIGSVEMQAAAMRAWALLSRRERIGWGWNFTQPADADSTAWVLRLAHKLDRSSDEPAQKALRFLRDHIDENGAVATYLQQGHAARFPDRAINKGWYGDHPDVTAAVAALPDVGASSRAWLLHHQQDDGSWRGYWWKDAAYTTATAATALAEGARPEEAAAVSRAAQAAQLWLERDTTLKDNPFALALALRTAVLHSAPDKQLLESCARELLHIQSPDGKWPATAALHFPNADGRMILAVDRAGIFTTATVLDTLAALHRARYFT
ncbi:MAG: hypothetical protein ABI240_05930 [Sphingomonas sp.]